MKKPKLERKVSTSVVTTQRHTMVVDREVLIHALNTTLPGLDVPGNAKIWCRVPGGGDWSNDDLEIDVSPIRVQWSVETREDK